MTLDRIYRAVADPTRRAIINQLLAGPARVTEIAEPYSVSLAAISKHLGILERAGLVRRQIRGREHWMRFDHGPLVDAAHWLDAAIEYSASETAADH